MAVALIAVGCGGSSESPEIAKAAFIKRANAICVAIQKKFETEVVAALHSSAEEPSQGSEVTSPIPPILAPNLKAEVDEISALGTPKGDEEKVSAILDAIQEVADNAESDPTKITKSLEPYGKPEKPANEYGIKACPLG